MVERKQRNKQKQAAIQQNNKPMPLNLKSPNAQKQCKKMVLGQQNTY